MFWNRFKRLVEFISTYASVRLSRVRMESFTTESCTKCFCKVNHYDLVYLYICEAETSKWKHVAFDTFWRGCVKNIAEWQLNKGNQFLSTSKYPVQVCQTMVKFKNVSCNVRNVIIKNFNILLFVSISSDLNKIKRQLYTTSKRIELNYYLYDTITVCKRYIKEQSLNKRIQKSPNCFMELLLI